MRRAVIETALMLMASGAMLGFATSYLVAPRFVADATIGVTGSTAALCRDAWNQTLSQESLVPMIFESSSWKDKLDLVPMEDLLRQIRDGSVMTSAALPGGATGFTIEFADEDRDVALDTMRALLLRMSDNTAKLKAAGGGTTVDGAHVVHAPRVRQAGPNRGLFTGAGMGCGLLAGLIVWWAAAMQRRSAPAALPPE